jgi:hypothetical protein
MFAYDLAMQIFLRRFIAPIILLSTCLTNGSTSTSIAHAKNEVAGVAGSAPVVPFQNCSDSVTSNCIVSVKFKDVDISFAGNVSTSQSESKCDGKSYATPPAPAIFCYQDSVPAYAAEPLLINAWSPRRGFKFLIAQSPALKRTEIQGGPSYDHRYYIAHFQPVLPTGAKSTQGDLVVSTTDFSPEDSWTVKINFGPVPPPNFWAIAGIDSYVISYDALGNTVVELKIRPLLLTRPGDDCTAIQGATDSTTIGNAYFQSTLVSADSMRKVFKFTNGFSVGTNSVCRSGDFWIGEDGAMNLGVEANHLRADGSLNEGYFSTVVSPSALQGFNVSPDLVLRGGLKVIREENGKLSELASTTEIQTDGSVRITATGFHYSGGTITVMRNKKLPLPAGKTTITSTIKTIKSGATTRIKIGAKKATGRVHVSILGPKGLKWSLGSGKLENGVANIDFVVPSSISKGKTSLFIWYEGSRTQRPITKVLSVVIR